MRIFAHVFRRFFKKKVTPAEKRKYYALAYGLLSWNFAGIMFWMVLNNGLPEDPEERRTFLRKAISPKSTNVIQITGNGTKFTVERFIYNDATDGKTNVDTSEVNAELVEESVDTRNSS